MKRDLESVCWWPWETIQGQSKCLELAGVLDHVLEVRKDNKMRANTTGAQELDVRYLQVRCLLCMSISRRAFTSRVSPILP